MQKPLFFILFCYFSHTIANQEPTENATHQFIELVKKEDQRLQNAQDFHNYFWSNHTYTTSETRGNTTYTYTYIKPYTSYELRREYYDAKDTIANFQDRLSKKFKKYSNNINDIDEYGKTALEYAQTPQMYNVLRSHGTHFQLDPYIKIYPWSSAALFGTTLLTAAYILYSYNPLPLLYTDKSMQSIPNIDTNNLEEQLAKGEIDLTIQDQFGRTFLINYVIQQNQQLKILNQRIENTPQRSLELYQLQYTKANLLITTEKNIKTMIGQNASIEIYDAFRKNCLNYCTIKELSHLFEKSNNIHSEIEENLIVAISMVGFYASIIGSILIIAQP